MRRAVIAVLAVTVALVAAGCDVLDRAFAEPPAQPQPCGQVFNAVRCQAMIDTAAFTLHRTREDITALVILPEPTPQVLPNGDKILQTRSGGPAIDTQVTLADGSTHLVPMNCGGIPSTPACFDEPHITTHSAKQGGGGYSDVPEGSSPVPSAAPDALADATELRLDGLDIAIDHTGPYDVRLGEAWLPNGLLTDADFALVDDWPADLTIIEGGVLLEVRSVDDGKPIWNIYEHGWHEGVERVEAFLVFDVFRFEPGAKLSISDVVVR